jgi:hypothetical protein
MFSAKNKTQCQNRTPEAKTFSITEPKEQRIEQVKLLFNGQGPKVQKWFELRGKIEVTRLIQQKEIGDVLSKEYWYESH